MMLAGRPAIWPPMGDISTVQAASAGLTDASVVASQVVKVSWPVVEDWSRLSRKELEPAVELVAGSRERMVVTSL
jgi:hypothetical protein